MKAKFACGQLVATPGALRAFESAGESPLIYLQRHVSGDWGELSAEDTQENERSLVTRLAIVVCVQAR
jgi:hypothetical protein